MKKIIVITLLSIIANIATAQNNKLIQDVNVGAIVATVASTTFSGGSQPFEVGYGLSASVVFVTKKTATNFTYSFGGNSVGMLNAYFLPKNWDIYVVGSKSLNSDGKYVGIGIEKMEKIGNVKFFEFIELGTGFQGKPILSFGLLLNPSWSLKKK
ncbi:MAG: hypothetical protein AAB477_00045 [Patescibacteria group bacterium]